VACAALSAAAALPRALGCGTDLWLDEVWSWHSLERLAGPLGVFSQLHDSNNHHLNTLWMYLVRAGPDWGFRLLALVTGTASVPLAAWLAGRRDPLAGAVAAILVGSCFLLIYFSSEARGYAPVVFFGLAGWAALEVELRTRRVAPALLFSACVILGFLSQLIALFFWAGASLWSTPRILRESRGREAALRLVRLHAAPALAFAALYGVDLRHLVVGRGPAFRLEELLASLGAYVFGLPRSPVSAPAVGLGVAAALALALLRLRRRGDDRWILHLAVIALVPAAVLGALRPEVIAARYFVISVAFALVLWSEPLAEWLRAGGARRAAAGLALALFVCANGASTLCFLGEGRGHYREALSLMAAGTRGTRIEVGGDHDFRVGSMLRYYARELPPGKELAYLRKGQRRAEGPEWLVVQELGRGERARPTFRDRRGNEYALQAEYDYCGVAGYAWAVYRNVRHGGARGAATPGQAEP
jgi:hypothetical protein